jgi:hypothetical protein
VLNRLGVLADVAQERRQPDPQYNIGRVIPQLLAQLLDGFFGLHARAT